ncbi:hypothetical protein GIS00_06685 [Nakamurella sp. YIM 132087]|uniref:Uncharacterized protein n=1 Tax=Nakamurella alba TaxID=2665158 RepID=A0A7K1FJL4_9ACTN|nr:hypothetical protein [Nakamurella alba]MTD13629.1 hypothetical protein [Nakamurella alba]
MVSTVVMALIGVVPVVGAATVPAGAAVTSASAAAGSLSIASSQAEVRIGQSTIVSGTAKSASGDRVAGGVIELWTRPVGSTAWSHVQNTRSNALGHFTFRYTPDQARVLQARLPGNAVVSPVATVGVRMGFDSFYAQGCYVGAPYIAMVGKAPKEAAGTIVTAEFYFNDLTVFWKRQSVGRVAADGSFYLSFSMSKGPWSVRAVLVGAPNVKGAVGPVWWVEVPLASPGNPEGCIPGRPATD